MSVSEDDYVNISTLTRVRVMRDVLSEVRLMPHIAPNEWHETMRTLLKWEAALSESVAILRDEEMRAIVKDGG